jgi:hypothetical protein
LSTVTFDGNTSVPQMTTFELSVQFFLRVAIILVVCRGVIYFLTQLQGEPMFNRWYRQGDGTRFKNTAA